MTKELVQEGKVQIQVDTASIVSKDLEVFYNPEMVLNRDITLTLLNTYFDKPICMALPLAGSGVRAVRIAKELPHLIKKLWVNDMSPQATQLIRENFQRNNIDIDDEIIKVCEKDACLFLEDSTGYDYIDIDPFGSPNQFLDTAIRKLSRKGILAVTATDTAALAGTYPKTCKRKYWATSAITPMKHEMGLRILTRKVQLLGIHNNKVLKPLLSYHDKHYYRIFFQVVKSKEKASQLLDQEDMFLNYDSQTADFSLSSSKDETKIFCGPFFSGELHDKEFLDQVTFEHKVISRAKDELATVGSYDIHTVCETYKLELISFEKISTALEEKGYKVSRCATNEHALKTTAPLKEIIQILKDNKSIS